jgi:biopolymer transport protein ExbD
LEVCGRQFLTVGKLDRPLVLAKAGDDPMNRLPMFCLGVLVLALLMGLTMPLLAADAKGKVASVTADKHEFVFTDNNGKNWTITMNKDAKVFINDKEGKLADLQAGDEVAVTYEKQGEKFLASEVRCARK